MFANLAVVILTSSLNPVKRILQNQLEEFAVVQLYLAKQRLTNKKTILHMHAVIVKERNCSNQKSLAL